MPVCLHCGELAPDGALFCAKCGFTLPQVDTTTAAVPRTPAAAPGASSPTPAPSSASVPPGWTPGPPREAAFPYPPGTVAAAYVVPLPPGATGPMQPPPSGKYCVHCRAVIARAAAYCPVCQQPQP